MKRFICVLSGLLVLPAFAEVAPVYYDDVVEYTDEMLEAEEPAVETEETAVAPAVRNVAKRGTINRSTSRAISSAANSSQRTNTSSRAIASSPRNAQKTSRGVVSRTAKMNAISNKSHPATVTARGTQSSKPVTARISANTTVMPASRTNASSSVTTLTDSGNAQYISSGRTISSSRRSTMRAASSLGATTPILTEEDISSTTSNLTAISELTEYCKAQYAACMDNYCNVLDDNQGRCSCSKNIKNYEKIETALKTATENFQDVVQKIKYIGLSADQINSLFAETEAELTMKSTSDKSNIRSSLDSIKKKIIDASSPSASSYTSSVSMDVSGLLNADFTTGFDLSSFLGNSAGGTSSVSNQRGEQLFKTATARCKTAVLNSCTSQGIDANVITNSYDLEIDKQCMAYERNLNEANTEMRNNINNASNILQQARLMLAQNKNSYDVRGCVAAIDSCMQDEYVCGDDYELCLDPTGKYLANAAIVKGGAPGVSGGTYGNETPIKSTTDLSTWKSYGMYGLYSAWNYKTNKVGKVDAGKSASDVLNAWSVSSLENLSDYINVAMTLWADNYTSNNPTDDMATYILQKIGYIDKNNKVHGMCASVMKQCQDYTFDTKKSSSKYKPDNEVIRQYLAATLTKIKLKQDSILADYAEDCRNDVSSCLSTNGYDESNPDVTTSKTAVNACRAEITTCMSVGGYMPKEQTTLTLRAMSDWVASMLISCPVNYYLYDTGKDDTNNKVQCIPCPQVTYVDGTKSTSDFLVSDGGQNSRCVCADGYVATDWLDSDEAYDEKHPGSEGWPLECTKESD
ncbi:MAG: hypothetical protein IKN73_03830 [Alphaproteobacteria bacterium]|nr:hypothetical protein [Alphaproteobacteria bacterium]